jgi:glycosyltransferase involved in cell wall biosynthesis
MHSPGDPGFTLLRERARAAGCPLFGVLDRGPLDLNVPRSLLRLCRNLGVRVWHGHDYKSNLIGLLLRPLHQMRLVTTAHGWVTASARTPLYYALDRWSLKRYDTVICVSADIAEHVRRLGIPEERCVVLPNAVDLEVFRRLHPAAESPIRARFGVPRTRLVLGAVGRLSPEKGFDVLVRAAAKLLEEDIDCEVWIAGEGPEESALRALIDTLRLGDRVRLLGFWSNPVELYQALDGLVLSSRREGLPNVVLEALAAQVPIVATRVPGLLGLLSEGQTGLLVPIDNVGGLTSALRRLLTDANLRAELARAGWALVETRHSFDRRVSSELAIYDRLLERSPVAEAAAGWAA